MLGQWEAQGAWEAMMRVENSINAYREQKDVPLELLRQLESVSRQYWTTALTVEAQHAPELQQHVPAKYRALHARRPKDVAPVLAVAPAGGLSPDDHPRCR